MSFFQAKRFIRIVKCYISDFRNHLKFSLNYIPEKKYSKDSLRCSILLLNHQLEKAQTYNYSKKGYGKEKLLRLINLIERYIKLYKVDNLMYNSIGIIESHFKNENSWKDNHTIEKFKSLTTNIDKKNTTGGIYNYTYKQTITSNVFENFLASRKSIREYSKEDISDQEIREAVKLAIYSPSACNRQTIRCHVYKDSSTINKIILSQKSDMEWCLNSNRLIIITSNRLYFRDLSERNQGMFDAGLFSMTLNLALHSMGIGSCFKMAQKYPEIDFETKQISKIADYEDICVLIVAGKYPDDPIKVAMSTRLDLTDILTIHQ